MYVNALYEKDVSGNLSAKYYYLGGQRIAMRRGSTLTYLHGDHLGSASLTTNTSGAKVSIMRYLPYGGLRVGGMPADRRFTGQREETGLGFYDYGARQYDPALGRFLQADTLVPNPGNPQSLNRYAYTLNNPLRYTDPSGHYSDDAIQTYLKNRFGDEWERYWNLWNADAGWMDLLHAAQSGDILTRITTDESGMALLDNLQFLGEGQAILSGVSLIDDISANPNKINNISLDHIFSHRGNGLGLTRFDANGDISVIGTIGNITPVSRKIFE